jgi:hypothetical protein
MHAKNTRERKKLKLNKLEELANQLEREIEELNHRSMHHDWGSALMVPSQHNTGVGASPAITELQARAGKLAMRVAAQDTMLAQLKQENAVLMAHIQAASHRARKLGSEVQMSVAMSPRPLYFYLPPLKGASLMHFSKRFRS